MTTFKSIVWLHLSDLHLCEPKTGFDAHRVLEPLIKDLKYMEQTHGLLPQLLFFTGDGAFGNYGSGKGASLAEQYEEVEALLTGVRKAFSQEIPKDHTFLVPGNHDVNRAEVTDSETHWIEQQAATDNVTRLIKDTSKQWKHFMDRLTNYRQFLEQNGYNHLLEDADRLIYSQIREINGIKLGIGGFNSAWNCCRDKEKGKLWLAADWQDGAIVGQLNQLEAHLKIALIHHPPGWFVDHEDALIRRNMENHFDFFLHGHEHQGWVNVINNHHVRIAADACYEKSDQENGYNFVRLNLETGDVEIWLRRFDGHGGGWIPRIIAGGKTDNDGLWNIESFPCLEKFKPSKSSAINSGVVQAKYPESLETDKHNKILPNSAMKPVRLFYSYAHEDERFRKNLGEHFSNLERQGLISGWHDRKITAGKAWANEIDENLEKADVVLLLISSKFIASDYCHEVEMKRALERHNQGIAIVVPILLKATDYKDCLFAHLQGLPRNFKPIEKWQHRDDAYVDIVNGLRKLIEEMQVKQGNSAQNQFHKEKISTASINVSSSTLLTVSEQARKEVREEIKKMLHKPVMNEIETILYKVFNIVDPKVQTKNVLI